MRRSVWLCVSALLIIPSSPGDAQQVTSWKWGAGADRVNRYEGLVSVEAANPDFELLSLVGSFEPFAADTELKVAFYLPPDPGNAVLILASGLSESNYYRMEAKQAKWQANSWNVFDHWDTGAVIDPQRIRHTDIGVAVFLSASTFASGPVAPAFVYHSKSTHVTSEYRLVFRARSTLASITYSVTAMGERQPTVQQTIEGGFIRKAPITLVVDASHLKEGPNVLQIKGDPVSVGAASVDWHCTFYHKR